MGTITVLSKERMLEIEAASIVDGEVNDDGDLILQKHDGTLINAGNVLDPSYSSSYAALSLSGNKEQAISNKDTSLDINLTGDLNLSLSGNKLGCVVAIRVKPNNYTFTLGDIVIEDEPATVTAWRMAEGWVISSGVSGSGTLEPVPGDVTAPTTPGAITATATSDGYNLSWLTSTDNNVVAGYEVSLDGGAWVDSGNNLQHSYTGLISGTNHYGEVRAYDANGNRSNARRWPTSGTLATLVQNLHDQILALNPQVYARMTTGSVQEFGSDAAVAWAVDGVTFDGPSLTPGSASSAHFTGDTTKLRTPTAPSLTNMTGPVTIIATYRSASGSGAGRLTDGTPGIRNFGVTSGSAGNELTSNGTTHLLVFTIDIAVGTTSKKTYRDGVLVLSEAWVIENAATIDAGLYLGNWEHGVSPQDYYMDRVAIIKGVAITQEKAESLARAAGTFGNPR